MKRLAFLICVVLTVLTVSNVAYSIPVGVVSFDNFIPADPTSAIPGVNAFNLNNLTGPSGLPPDFPVTDSLIFDNSNLVVTFADGSTQSISLGDIGPGLLSDSSGNPLFNLQFADTTNFMSASFTAILNEASFLLADGSTFNANSTAVIATILPSTGAYLSAGVDYAVIDVAPAASPVPEPSTLILMAIGLMGFLVLKRNVLERKISEIKE
ncbi:MAG: PEP-CTERM sorting domain-containing protein [Nitrospiria bacterium]